MQKIIDEAIIIRRVNYAEKDRVLTVLCKNSGKISLFAKGVKSQKSKLSSGIELLNINEIGYISGKSGMQTLTSAHIKIANQNIVKDINRTNLVFENFKLLNKIIEDYHGQEFYDFVKVYLITMNDLDLNYAWVEVWFRLKIMRILGILSDLNVDNNESDLYKFDWENQIFIANANGTFSPNEIKFIRIQLLSNKPIKLDKPLGSEQELLNFTRLLLENNL